MNLKESILEVSTTYEKINLDGTAINELVLYEGVLDEILETFDEEYNQLKQQLSQLRQNYHDLLIVKTEKMDIIMNQSSAIEKLQQEKEDLIKWLEENIEKENNILKMSLTQESKVNSLTIIACFEQLLSKLKESDKNDS